MFLDRKKFNRHFAHLVRNYQRLQGAVPEGRMQLVPLCDKGQMKKDHSSSYLSSVIINVVLNMEISDESRGRQGPED